MGKHFQIMLVLARLLIVAGLEPMHDCDNGLYAVEESLVAAIVWDFLVCIECGLNIEPLFSMYDLNQNRRA